MIDISVLVFNLKRLIPLVKCNVSGEHRNEISFTVACSDLTNKVNIPISLYHVMQKDSVEEFIEELTLSNLDYFWPIANKELRLVEKEIRKVSCDTIYDLTKKYKEQSQALTAKSCLIKCLQEENEALKRPWWKKLFSKISGK